MKSVVGLYENRQAVGGATDPQLHSNRTVIHFKREYLVQLYYTRGRRRQTHPGHPKGCVPLKGGKDPRQRVGGSVQGKETYTHPPAKAPRRITIRISIYAPPCGGRPCWDAVIRSVSEFQSTPPYGSDHCRFFYFFVCSISIHAPIRGRLSAVFLNATMLIFQSTPPCGGDFI